MRRRIFLRDNSGIRSLFVILLSFVVSIVANAQSIEESLDPGKMYIYTQSSDNHFTTFFEGDEWSIQFSGTDSLDNKYGHPVALYTVGGTFSDSTYFEISDIDSIVMYQPEPVMKPGVFELIYDYFQYIEDVQFDDSVRTIRFYPEVNALPLPSVGQKIVCNIFEEPLPVGMMGTVISITQEDGRVVMRTSRIYDSLLDFYDSIIYDGNGEDPAFNKAERQALAKRVVAPGLAKRQRAPWHKPAAMKGDKIILDATIGPSAGFSASNDEPIHNATFGISLKVEGTYQVTVSYSNTLFGDDSHNASSRGVNVFVTTKTKSFGIHATAKVEFKMGWRYGLIPLHAELPKSQIPGEGTIEANAGLYLDAQAQFDFWAKFPDKTETSKTGITISGDDKSNSSTSGANAKPKSSTDVTLSISGQFSLVRAEAGFKLAWCGDRELSGQIYFSPLRFDGKINLWGNGATDGTKVSPSELYRNYEITATGSFSAGSVVHLEGTFKVGSGKWEFLNFSGSMDYYLWRLDLIGYPQIDGWARFLDNTPDEDYRPTNSTVSITEPVGTFHVRTTQAALGYYDLDTRKYKMSAKKEIPSFTFINHTYDLGNINLPKGHCYKVFPIIMKEEDDPENPPFYMSPTKEEDAKVLRVPCDVSHIESHNSWKYYHITSRTNFIVADDQDITGAKAGIFYSSDASAIRNLDEKTARNPGDNVHQLFSDYFIAGNNFNNIIQTETEGDSFYYRAFVSFADTAYFFGSLQYGETWNYLVPITRPIQDRDKDVSCGYINTSAEVYSDMSSSYSNIVYGMKFCKKGNAEVILDLNSRDNSKLFDDSELETRHIYKFNMYDHTLEPDCDYTYYAYVTSGNKSESARNSINFTTDHPFTPSIFNIPESAINYYDAEIESEFPDDRVTYYFGQNGSGKEHHCVQYLYLEVIPDYYDFNETGLTDISNMEGAVRVSYNNIIDNSIFTKKVTGLLHGTDYKVRAVTKTTWDRYYPSTVVHFSTKNIFDSKMVSAVTDKKTDVTTFKATISQPLLDQIKAGSGHKIRFVYYKQNGGSSIRTDFINPSSTNVSYALPRRLDYATDYKVSLEVIPEGIDPDDINSHINGWIRSSNTVSFTTPHPYRMSVPFFADLLDYQDGFTLQFQPSEECERRRLEEGQDIEFLFYLWEDHDAPHSVIDPTQDDMKDAVKELYPDSYSDSQHLGFLTYMACYPLQWYGLQPVVRVNGVSYPSEKKDIIYFKNDNPDNWVVKLLPAEATDADVTLHGQMSPAIKAILDDTAYEYSHLGKPNLRFQYRNAFDFDNESSWTDVPVKEVPGPVQEGKPVDFYTTLSMKDGLVPLEVYYYRVILDFEGRTNKPYYHNQNPDAIEEFKIDPFKILNLKATADPDDGTHFTVSAEIGEAGHQMLKTDGQTHFYYFECSEDPEFSDIAAFTGYKDLKDSRMLSGEFDYVDIMTTYYVRCVITGGADGSEDQYIVSDSECKVTTSDIDPGLIIGKPEKGTKPVKKKAVK